MQQEIRGCRFPPIWLPLLVRGLTRTFRRPARRFPVSRVAKARGITEDEIAGCGEAHAGAAIWDFR